MKSEEVIANDMRQMVADVLGLKSNEVQSSARFFQDLNGESIDLLELGFHCEKKYRCKVPLNGMIPEDLRQMDADGLTPEFLQTAQVRLPFLDLSRLSPRPSHDDLLGLITVDALAKYITLVVENAPSDRTAL